MCTVVISLAPEDRVPLLLLGVRDEFTGRPWRPPARHWPGSPLIGGLDKQAGGTWLAVHPDVPRVGCILNGRGEFAPPGHRRTRGELPLHAAAEGQAALRALPGALADYDPFHLVCADLTTVSVLSWDGSHAALTELAPGTHVLTNAGHMYPPADEQPADEQPADEQPADEKAAWFGPKFAAHRPSGDQDATIKDAWADWLTLAAGDDLASTDPAAIIVRRELPDGRIYGSTSVSLVALATDGAFRYDFQSDPPDPTTWYSVDTKPR